MRSDDNQPTGVTPVPATGLSLFQHVERDEREVLA
jgi:hypothetical protein